MAFRFRERIGQILFLLLLFGLFLAIAAGSARLVLDGGSASYLPAIRFARPGLLRALLQSPEFLLLLFSGGVLCLLLPVLAPIRASLLALAATTPFLYLGFADAGRPVLIPLEFSLLAILMLFSVDVLIGYFRETHLRQQIIAVFGQYIPPQLVNEISRQPEQLDLSGEARELTVFFCDLHNFSGVAEQLNPRQLALLLNEYFTVMTEILFRFDATIDKYIGDSIMAFWGAPVRRPDHARRAVLAALDMQREIRVLSDQFVSRGWPPLSMGVGINTGIMNVGNMGSRYRIAYTVVGDAVNLAARLETLTRDYGVPCITSESTRDAAQEILFRPLDVVQVKGKHNRTRIYEPLCRREDADQALLDRLDLHVEGIDCYFSGQRDEAARIFTRLAAQDPADGFYPVMLKKLGT